MPISQNPKPQSKEKSERSGPSAEFKDANLRIAIWPSNGDDGVVRYNVILTRSYQSNGTWKDTPYLGKPDLQRAIKLLNRADDWIFNTYSRTKEYGGTQPA